MYRILIADDEDIIREGIKCLFNYEALGFCICDEAANGEQAYRKMIDLRPDVVLMDIRMPGMSGLEAVKKARTEGFEGKIVIVSSYSDFQYAQEAIRCGVQNYITKPIDEDELAQIFQQFKLELDAKCPKNDTPSMNRDAALIGLLLGHGNAQEYSSVLSLEADAYQVVICQSTDPSMPFQAERIDDLLRLTGQSTTHLDMVTLDDSIALLLKGCNAICKFNQLLQSVQKREFYSLDNPFDSLLLACGQSVATLEEIACSYQNALMLSQRRFFFSPGQHVLTYGMLQDASELKQVLSHALLEEYAGKLCNYVQTFNRKLTVATLQELEARIAVSSDSVDSIRLFFADLYLQIKEHMNHLYSGGSIPFYSNTHIIQTIQQAAYLNDITCFLAQRFDMIMSAIGTPSRDSVLDDILHYVHHNYASNITLENIAPLFGYNHSYLGKIFRKKMGCSFNAYLDHVRIERAKELLLQDDAKVYTISARVGYKNVDYFHVKFRKYVNQSPAEFRKNNKALCSPRENTEKGSLF